ncbi:uncharacterized protein LOC130927131 isoform X2 [Corythoichthys intestinalis]|uniref:uncharacterized protein LOC130911307 isoform X2 n=1 Tax=Corythoichthys intestinalis TaxID=161448 RepID=UPI0025A528C9|nr:uncharacterized protein LOC130911307 isoform X2 [Corythoichthys intestinalis]XP_057702477.1 uncharacterized protein LOC130922022 isoform X2 [Corythoichthys intestinalis]XP_057707795.1 uncharacterized protein LOC130926708 isoform X2 [Corythoichthys intestinalis]XP_057708694.1 uncharacterized protein LOC130927131 isoform X2 [Corythoichthys intestinalis]
MAREVKEINISNYELDLRSDAEDTELTHHASTPASSPSLLWDLGDSEADLNYSSQSTSDNDIQPHDWRRPLSRSSEEDSGYYSQSNGLSTPPRATAYLADASTQTDIFIKSEAVDEPAILVGENFIFTPSVIRYAPPAQVLVADATAQIDELFIQPNAAPKPAIVADATAQIDELFIQPNAAPKPAIVVDATAQIDGLFIQPNAAPAHVLVADATAQIDELFVQPNVIIPRLIRSGPHELPREPGTPFGFIIDEARGRYYSYYFV